MNNNDDLPSVEELDAKIKKAKAVRDNAQNVNGQVLSSTRVSLELFSGVTVGAGLGYFFDRWLNTMPVFLIIFFFFGVAAGALNIYKLTTKNIEEDGETDK